MSIIKLLKEESVWNDFLQYKINTGHLSKQEQIKLDEYIQKKEYMSIVESILNKEKFSIPEMKHINKKNSTKKRTVFIFNEKENYVLKAIMFLLHKYDYLFAPNLYSFRRNVSVKLAIDNINCKVKIDLLKKEGKILIKSNVLRYFTIAEIEKNILKCDSCKIMFLRGILLMHGSVSDPQKSYRIDLSFSEKTVAEGIKNLFDGFSINLKLIKRKDKYVL